MNGESVVVTIPGEPVAQGRPKFSTRGGFPRAYEPSKSRNWKAMAREFMVGVVQDDAGALRIWHQEGPVSVEITAVFTCPKGDQRKRDPRPERWHSKRPDAENVAKAVLDAATGVLYTDDSQVAVLLVHKRIGAQGAAPYVRIEVNALETDL